MKIQTVYDLISVFIYYFCTATIIFIAAEMESPKSTIAIFFIGFPISMLATYLIRQTLHAIESTAAELITTKNGE